MLRLDRGLGYAVFVQRAEPRIDVVGLATNAERWFQARVVVLESDAVDAPGALPTRARVALELSGERREFRLTARLAGAADLAAAERAEARGRAGGMAALAARCPVIWELEPLAPGDERMTLTLAALAASLALGPVLPPDGSTLFGVRGARERAERVGQKE
jgi:hypothetical protein